MCIARRPVFHAQAKVVVWAAAFAIAVASGIARQQGDKAQEHADRGAAFAQAGDLVDAETEFREALTVSPGSPEYLAGLGGILGMEHKLEEATVYFEKALKIDPNNLKIRRDLAATEWQTGQLRQARQNLEWILKSEPRDKSSILLLGMVAENLKDYARAAKLFAAVPDLVSQRPESIAALARSYYRTGQKQRAQAALSALLMHPAGPEDVFLGGQVASEEGDGETALKLFTSIESTYPDPNRLAYNYAQAQYRASRFRECQNTLFGLIGTGHETGDAFNLLAWCYYRQGKYKETVQAFDQAIDLEPRKESNYLDLGQTLIEHRLYSVAWAVAQKAVGRIPNSYRIYMLKGMVEAKQARYVEAIKCYAKSVELNPGSPEANFNLARVQSLAGLTKEAEATFEHEIQTVSSRRPNLSGIALMLLRLVETGDSKAESRAVSLLEAAIAQDRSVAEPHFQLGNLWLREEKVAAALEELKEAEKLDPKNSEIHFALSRAYRHLGRTNETAKEFELYQSAKAEEEKATTAFFIEPAKRWEP